MKKIIILVTITVVLVSVARQYKPILVGPQAPMAKDNAILDQLDKRSDQFLTFLEKKRECLRDRTCSRAVLKNFKNLAFMIMVLSAYVYVGKKAVKAIKRDEETPVKGRVKPTLIQKEEPVIVVPEKPASGVPIVEQAWKDIFHFVEKVIADENVDHIGFLLPEYATAHRITNLNDVHIDGYSLIGAVLKSGLRIPNKYEVIQWLQLYGVEPTARDAMLAQTLDMSI